MQETMKYCKVIIINDIGIPTTNYLIKGVNIRFTLCIWLYSNAIEEIDGFLGELCNLSKYFQWLNKSLIDDWKK